MVNGQQPETAMSIRAKRLGITLASKEPKQTEQPEYENPTKKRKEREESEDEDSTASTAKKAKRNIGSQDTKKRKEREESEDEDSTASTAKKAKSDSTTKIRYRCSFNGICSFLSKYFEEDEEIRKQKNEEIRKKNKKNENPDKSLVWFTELQLKKLMDSPFWNVLNFFISGRKMHHSEWWGVNDAILKIVRRYSSDTDEEHAFVFHDSENNPVIVKSSSEKLACFFGMKIVDYGIDSSRVLHTPSEIAVSDPVVDRMQAMLQGEISASQMQKSLIEGSILYIMRVKPEKQTEKDAEDLAKLFTLYLCVTVFFTSLNGCLSYKQFGGYFKTLHKMNRTCWPDLIHSYLMESIRNNINSPGNVSGCGMYLLYLFAEHCNAIVPKYTGFPRMAKWSVPDIVSKIEDDAEGAMKQMSRTLVTPYQAEEKRNIMGRENNFELLRKFSELVNFIEEKSKEHLQNMRDKDKPESDLCNKSVQMLEAIFDKKSKLASTDKQTEAAASSIFREQPDLHRGEQNGLSSADIKEKEEENDGGLVPKKVGNVGDFQNDFEEAENIGSMVMMDVQDQCDFHEDGSPNTSTEELGCHIPTWYRK